MTGEQRAIAHIASDTPGTAMCGEPMPHYEWFALGLADQCDECVRRFKAYRRGTR